MIDQLTASDKSKAVVNGAVVANGNQKAAVDWLVNRMSNATGEDSQQLAALVREYTNRQNLLSVIRSDIQMSAIQSIWLYFHVPMSFGCVAAIAHIISVFLYW